MHPIWIIGAPRSGSTILYQLLTSSGKLAYINNFISLFHRNLFIGFILNNILFKTNKHHCFRSTYGNTWKCGWKGPNESGNFWYNWLSPDNNYNKNNYIEEAAIKEIRKTLYAIINYSNKPLLIKNLYSGQRLPLIKKVAPDSKIIYIQRNQVNIVESIINARRKLGVKNDELWSIQPKEWKDLISMEEDLMVINQIIRLENQIEEDLRLFPSENILVVNYEDIPEKINAIVEFCDIHDMDVNTLLSQINFSDGAGLSGQRVEELKKKIKEAQTV